jgi:hypothetical protein
VYGDDDIAEPIFVPSILNWTFVTPTLSEAVAEMVTDEPETVAPLVGAVRETVGGVISAPVVVAVVVAEAADTLSDVSTAST